MGLAYCTGLPCKKKHTGNPPPLPPPETPPLPPPPTPPEVETGPCVHTVEGPLSISMRLQRSGQGGKLMWRPEERLIRLLVASLLSQLSNGRVAMDEIPRPMLLKSCILI